MNRQQRRADTRAARHTRVERSPQKRAALSFVTGVLMGLALPIALLLAGCTEEVSTTRLKSGIVVENDWGSGAVSIVDLPDGEATVRCAVLIGSRKGGISCDWDGAR